VLSGGLFRETARMKHGVKQSKRHEMSTESITRTGCPESTPITECCVDATTTNYMTANGGARSGIARQWRKRIWRPKAGRSETRQTQLRLDTPTTRRRRAARTMSRCHARTTASFVGWAPPTRFTTKLRRGSNADVQAAAIHPEANAPHREQTQRVIKHRGVSKRVSVQPPAQPV
jgi:hypothetical protein